MMAARLEYGTHTSRAHDAIIRVRLPCDQLGDKTGPVAEKLADYTLADGTKLADRIDAIVNKK